MSDKWNVLVVDDELDMNKKYFEMYLTPEYFNVRWAQTKSEFEGQDISVFDAVILDVNLDHWDLGFVKALRVIGDAAPIVLVSAKMPKEKTLIRIQDGIELADSVSIVQIFDMSLLANLDEMEATNVAKVYSVLLMASIKRNRAEYIDPDSEINILHISDPQYGDPGTEDWSAFIENDIATYLKRYESIDFVCITGDIVFSGKTEEYELAKPAISRLVTSVIGTCVNDPLERLVMVPGNHDVDFRMSCAPSLQTKFCKDEFGNDKILIKHEPDGHVGDKPSLYGMANYRRFAYQLTGDDRWLCSTKLNWIDDRFSSYGIRFICLNSAEDITWKSPKQPRLTEGSLSAMKEKAFLDVDNYFTIAISHHGPIDPDYPEEIETFADDWPIISNFLRNAGVKLWLHGHGHGRITMPFPYGVVHKDEMNKLKAQITGNKCFLQKGQFIRVMAPTTHLRENLRLPEERKGFHVVKLVREKGVVKFVEVHQHEVNDKGASELKQIRFTLK